MHQEWFTERKSSTLVDVVVHDQKIDGKNMMHWER
jgi:hypothetical protein